MQSLFSVLLSEMEQVVEYNQYFSQAMAYIGAAIAVLTGVSQGIGQSMVAAKACESIARQPEMAGRITTAMIVGAAVAETTGLYAFITAILILSQFM